MGTRKRRNSFNQNINNMIRNKGLGTNKARTIGNHIKPIDRDMDDSFNRPKGYIFGPIYSIVIFEEGFEFISLQRRKNEWVK